MATSLETSGRSRADTCVTLALAAWAGNALYAFGEPGGLLKFWSPALVAGAMIGFFVVHGRALHSDRQLLGFAATVFVVGWAFEALSIATGFPFGDYHYTNSMAPFMGHVSVFVMPAYLVMGYVAWSMARIFLGRFDNEADATLRYRVPIVAALLMVIWDLSLDPLRATVEQRWIWRDGGPHLGVPVENYFGWALVTWVMFQSFALLFLPRERTPRAPAPAETRRYWLSVPMIYVAFAVEYLVNPVAAARSATMVPVNGVPTRVVDIFTDVAQVTATTMIPAALLAAFLVQRFYGRNSEQTQPGLPALIEKGQRR